MKWNVNIWNSLPNAVVDVDSVDLFKSRLDNFWRFQDVKYDYTTNLAGTGDRSEYDIESYSYWKVVLVFQERYGHGSSEPASVNIIDLIRLAGWVSYGQKWNTGAGRQYFITEHWNFVADLKLEEKTAVLRFFEPPWGT